MFRFAANEHGWFSCCFWLQSEAQTRRHFAQAPLALGAEVGLVLFEAALDIVQSMHHGTVKEDGQFARGGYGGNRRAAPSFDAPVKTTQGQMLAFGYTQNGFAKNLSHHRLGPG